MSMSDGAIDWNRLEELFHATLALEPSDRADFLERTCGGDAALRQEIESLIAFSGGNLDSLKRPVERIAQTLAWAESGKSIGPYRLMHLLGDGGMGQVYLAERADALYEQRVAIKLMHAGVGRSAAMLLRFTSERQILANLNHPHVARLLDAGLTPEGATYLVMEYIDGLHIDEYCRSNKLDT